MSRYALTPTAQQDLADLRDYYLEQGGPRLARQMLVEFVETFRFLAKNPGVGHVREDLAEDRLILFWPMRDYLIVYERTTKPLKVLMILHGSRDIPKQIRLRD